MHMSRRLLGALLLISLVHAQSGVAQEQPEAAESPPAVQQPRLDLRPPKITDLLTEDAIDVALRATRDLDTLEEVEVEGRFSRQLPRAPIVPFGIAAPFWALANPLQAWRILLPMTSEQADSFGAEPPDPTDPYLPPTVPPL